MKGSPSQANRRCSCFACRRLCGRDAITRAGRLKSATSLGRAKLKSGSNDRIQDVFSRQPFKDKRLRTCLRSLTFLERKTGFEPAALALARRCSTAELLPLIWWLRAESNRRHADFQSAALPTELPSRIWLAELTGLEPAISGLTGRCVRPATPQFHINQSIIKDLLPGGR